ncbi:hypothetical protein B0H16DRAFT_1476888 [Mycena metata]|uniref:Uncharacterized protein n=1 Tax=Mycena metata TaxID=1033252 RepID=A0AAD7MGF1_9AGAR|nr:hypothetical protein B0H16DRAFT_1476888 [Mycena metata]
MHMLSFSHCLSAIVLRLNSRTHVIIFNFPSYQVSSLGISGISNLEFPIIVFGLEVVGLTLRDLLWVGHDAVQRFNPKVTQTVSKFRLHYIDPCSTRGSALPTKFGIMKQWPGGVMVNTHETDGRIDWLFTSSPFDLESGLVEWLCAHGPANIWDLVCLRHIQIQLELKLEGRSGRNWKKIQAFWLGGEDMEVKAVDVPLALGSEERIGLDRSYRAVKKKNDLAAEKIEVEGVEGATQRKKNLREWWR